MPASVDRLQFAPPPPPGMLRAFAFAVVAHLLLLLALTWGVNWKRDPVTLSAAAELWSTVPQEAAPKLVEPPPPPPSPAPVPVPVPVPAPAPAPVVEPPKPEPEPAQADIAVEREREKQAEARRKQLALEREKKREAQQQQQQAEQKKKQELAKARAAEERQKQETAKRLKQADEAKRMEAQRQANIRRMQGLAGATGSPSATGSALRSSGPSSTYGGKVAARVKPNIVFGEEIAGNPSAEIEVRTAPDGTIVGQRIYKSSGVRSWDEAVLKAVIKTQVLPRDIDGRVPPSLIIDFRPKD
jgi:colicin import membrane protein